MPRIVFLFLVAGLLFLLDLYVFQAFRIAFLPFPESIQLVITVLYWGFTAVTVSTLFLTIISANIASSARKRYLLSLLFIVFAAKLIVALILLAEDASRLIRWIIDHFQADPDFENLSEIPRKAWVSYLALASGTIPLLALIYGMVRGAFQYQLKKIIIASPNLPAGFQGFKMIQISDLHTGSFQSDKPLRKAVKLINEQQADVIFFTGDLVNNVADEVQPFIPVLGQLSGKMGVFSVLGNHDYGDYVRWPNSLNKIENLERLKQAQARMGWRLLLNEHVILERNGDKIALLGIENWGNRAGFPKYGKLYKAYAGTENYPFRILLSHDPSHWDGEVNQKYPGIDLMLSGHTHGMQFGLNLPKLKWSPVQYVYKQWSGLYKKGTQYLYVNVGLGFLGYPGRVGFLPEITVFELRQA